MSYAFVAWMAGYRDVVRGYSKKRIKRLMESFEITLVSLAEDSVFCADMMIAKLNFWTHITGYKTWNGT